MNVVLTHDCSWLRLTFQSGEDDLNKGCGNVSPNQQQFFSGLTSPVWTINQLQTYSLTYQLNFVVHFFQSWTRVLDQRFKPLIGYLANW